LSQFVGPGRLLRSRHKGSGERSLSVFRLDEHRRGIWTLGELKEKGQNPERVIVSPPWSLSGRVSLPCFLRTYKEKSLKDRKTKFLFFILEDHFREFTDCDGI
jgi:hypothetical protein